MAIHEGLPPSGPSDKDKDMHVEDAPTQNGAEGIHDDTIGLSQEELAAKAAQDRQIKELVEAGIKARLAETQPDKKVGLTKRAKALIAGAVGAAVTATAIVIGVTKSGDNEKTADEFPTTTQSAPATTGPTEALPTKSAPTTEAPKPTRTPEVIAPTNPELIAALDNMTAAEFAKQPASARRSWFASKLKVTLFDGADSRAFVDPITFEAYTLQDGTKLLEHSPVPSNDPDAKTTPLTRNSNPKQVLGYDLYVRNMVSSRENDPLNGQGRSGKDVNTAEKMLSGNIDSTKSKEYENDRKSLLANTGKLTALKTAQLKAYDVVSASPRLYKVKDSEGEIREAQTITYSANNGHNSIEYIFQPVPEFGESEEGLPYGIWVRNEHKTPDTQN